jgi:hypothetical protein
MAHMDVAGRHLTTHRSGGVVAVVAIRCLDDLPGGAGRFRINLTADVSSQPRQSRTVVGAEALRAAVSLWVDQVVWGCGRTTADGEHQ